MTLRIDLDPILPEERVILAAERAAEENPANVVGREGLGTYELALSTERRWRPGRALKIEFMGGESRVRERVVEIARQWTEGANIDFDFGVHRDPDLRIAFEPGPSWAWIGTDARAVDREHPTMNFGWLKPETPEADYRRVVLHEFGHALGCIHEHQSPAGGVPWDEEKVYAYYMGDPINWSKVQVWENIFQKYDGDSTQYGEFDPASIMVYHIPKELTLGGYEVAWNTELSDNDRKVIAEAYA